MSGNLNGMDIYGWRNKCTELEKCNTELKESLVKAREEELDKKKKQFNELNNKLQSMIETIERTETVITPFSSGKLSGIIFARGMICKAFPDCKEPEKKKE